MPDHRATYAARFNTRGIRRPKPPRPYAPLTDEQIALLPVEAQRWARLSRDMYQALAPFRAAIEAMSRAKLADPMPTGDAFIERYYRPELISPAE